MAADMCHVDVTGVHLISIPAPPRGATRKGKCSAGSNFNSRPSARGDAVVGAVTCRAYTFQFTPLREGRRRYGRAVMHQAISIHAPPRGATHPQKQNSVVRKFQFTPLREGRQDVGFRRCPHSYFNSRPSARGDASSSRRLPWRDISIHAPPRGATPLYANDKKQTELFQFTPSSCWRCAVR